MATKKQTKKSEAPIDEKETFISIQTNASDSDISMEKKLHVLYQLQDTDTKIDKIHLLRGELPLEVQDLEDEIEGLKTRVTNLQNEIKEIEKDSAQKRVDINSSKDLVKRYEEQRNDVKNNREYDSLSKEIEYQTLVVEHAEKIIKDNSIKIVDKTELLNETKKEYDGRKIDLENKKKELESIIKETAKEEEVLIEKSNELKSMLEDRMVIAYERVRGSAKNRLAVVTVKRDACGGCFNKIPPQRQLDIALSRKIIVCEYCGRIIVSSEFENE